MWWKYIYCISFLINQFGQLPYFKNQNVDKYITFKADFGFPLLQDRIQICLHVCYVVCDLLVLFWKVLDGSPNYYGCQTLLHNIYVFIKRVVALWLLCCVFLCLSCYSILFSHVVTMYCVCQRNLMFYILIIISGWSKEIPMMLFLIWWSVQR